MGFKSELRFPHVHDGNPRRMKLVNNRLGRYSDSADKQARLLFNDDINQLP